MLVVGVGGQHHHGHLWVVSGQHTGGLDAVEPRHVEVHQHHVRLVRTDRVDGLLAVAGGTDDGDAVEHAEQHLQALTHHPLVVDDQDADGVGHRSVLAPS